MEGTKAVTSVITPLGDLLGAPTLVHALVSTRADQRAIVVTDFVRQKTAKGVAIVCWRGRNAAEEFLARIPNGKTDYRMIELDRTILSKMVANFGVQPEQELAVVIDSNDIP